MRSFVTHLLLVLPLTKDRKYYDVAVKMLDYVQEPFEGQEANLFVNAAGRFLDMDIENTGADFRVLALPKVEAR